MTNIYGTPEKVEVRDRLWEAGLETLKQRGWSVLRVPGAGKSSLRQITKDGQSKLVAIRTTQDRWMAFPRTKDDAGWLTLDDVDLVMAVSVDDTDEPKMALVHLFEQKDIKARYDRAYAARKRAGRSIPVGRGVWISLYREECASPVSLVGAGAGLAFPPIALVPLDGGQPPKEPSGSEASPPPPRDPRPLTIAEAKERLALTFGVDPSHIKITVEA